MRNNFEQQPNNEFGGLLEVRRVDTSSDRTGSLTFAVSENFTIFITSSTHQHLFESYGVDPDRTLAEGYIKFSDAGRVQNVRFKPTYQPSPGFKGGPEQLEQLKAEIEKIIRNEFNS